MTLFVKVEALADIGLGSVLHSSFTCLDPQ